MHNTCLQKAAFGGSTFLILMKSYMGIRCINDTNWLDH